MGLVTDFAKTTPEDAATPSRPPYPERQALAVLRPERGVELVDGGVDAVAANNDVVADHGRRHAALVYPEFTQGLFDLPALQGTCGQRWDRTLDKTLAVAQELYDGDGKKKLITHPRAEARYLSENQVAGAPTNGALLRL